MRGVRRRAYAFRGRFQEFSDIIRNLKGEVSLDLIPEIWGEVPEKFAEIGKIGFWGFWWFGIKGALMTVSAGALSIVERLPFLASWNPRWGIGILRGCS